MLPERKWELEGGLLACLGALVFMTFAGMLASWSGWAENEVGKVVLGTVSFHGGILFGVQWLLHHHRLTWTAFLGLDRPDWHRSAVMAAVVALLFLPVGLGLSLLSAQVLRTLYVEPAPQQAVAAVQEAASWFQVLLMTMVAVVLAPVAEELLFRGLAYPALRGRLGRSLACVVTSVVFGAIHLNAMSFVPLTAFAVLLVALYERTGTLMAPVLAHSAFNAANMALLLLQ